MLILEVILKEDYDEEENLFVPTEIFKLRMEHSLVSLSKWEQKYEKPFLSDDDKTAEETMDYIKFMALDDVSDEIFNHISDSNVSAISEYINSSMTATWFSDRSETPRSKAIVTNEIIYYWMTQLGIDMECQNWHLNRLITLIRVVNEKNAPPKKMSRADNIRERNRLNQERQSRMGR